MVQYTCTTLKEQANRAAAGERNPGRMECYPLVRLFRRCGKGPKMFHVETTAWEGQLAYEAPTAQEASEVPKKTPVVQEKPEKSSFAAYGGYFWSKN